MDSAVATVGEGLGWSTPTAILRQSASVKAAGGIEGRR